MAGGLHATGLFPLWAAWLGRLPVTRIATSEGWLQTMGLHDFPAAPVGEAKQAGDQAGER